MGLLQEDNKSLLSGGRSADNEDLFALKPSTFKCIYLNVVSWAQMAHILHFWTHQSFFASGAEGLFFYHPEAARIHHYSPGHLPVTGNRHVEADDMSPRVII